MSNTGGDDGDGNTPLSPEMTADDPLAALLGLEGAELDQTADGDDVPPSKPPAGADQTTDDGGTQDTGATEDPQQGDDQAADPPQSSLLGSTEAQPQDPTSVQTPSPSGTEPATPSRGGIMSNLLGWVAGVPSGRGRRSSSATAGSTNNVLQRSNTSIASGSRPVPLEEELESQTPESQVSELIGPSRRRLNSQGSGSQGNAGSPPGGGNAGSRARRADTGLSLATEFADLEATGENIPTPIGVRNRPNLLGPRSAGGSGGDLPNTPVDPDWELRRRNRALLGIFEQMRTYEVTDDWHRWQEDYDRAREWQFQLGVNTLNEMAAEGVEGMRNVLAAAGARVPADIQAQIVEEMQSRAQATRDRVNNALIDERIYLENTTNNIVGLMERSEPTPSRRRGISRSSGTSSLDTQASQPELPPLDRRALMRNSREELVNMVLALEQRRQEAVEIATELEDAARETEDAHQTETTRLRAEANTVHANDVTQIDELRLELNFYRDLAEEAHPAVPPRQGPVDRPPIQDSSEGSAPSLPSPSLPSRSRAGSAPRSPAREQTFADLANLLGNLTRQEGLVRRLQDGAGLNTEALDSSTAPFSANAQLSRTQLLLQLREMTEEIEASRLNEDRLQAQIDALEAARLSPPGRLGTSLFGNLFGGNPESELSSSGYSRSRSGSRVAPARPPQNLADELGGQGSGGASDPGSRQSPRSRRQSEAGSRQSNGPSSNTAGYRTPSEGGSRQSGGSSRRSNASGGGPDAMNPAPLRTIPEWLAMHPHGRPCGACVPVFRFPPELGELPTCGCICDFSLGNPPPSARGSTGPGSSRSRASSGRSVRFVDDQAAADEGTGRRRPPPLDLAALGLVEEENDADRPNTPYPADAEGRQPGAPAPAGQAETVPIQAPEEEGPAVVDPAVEAPAIAAPAGRRGERCPCCGRGTFGNPSAGRLPQVAFYTCRNMAGQPVTPRAVGPVSLAEGFRNVLAAAATAAGIPARRGGGNADAPAGVEPAAPGTPESEGRPLSTPPSAPISEPEPVPRDLVMTFLTLFWDLFSFPPLLWFRNLLLSVVYVPLQWGMYLKLRYLAGQNVIRPMFARVPVLEIGLFVAFVLAVWLATMVLALYEERRIWRADNAQLSAAYFRGLGYRRPYPFWSVFEADTGLVLPLFGRLSETVHGWFFTE